MSQDFKEQRIESEPTAPGGGRMRWTVEVEPPDPELGEIVAMIAITEDAVDEHDPGIPLNAGKDCLLIDIETAHWLRDRLNEVAV